MRGRAAYSSDFENFWASYPKKVGKLGAYREWARAIKRTSVGVIIAAVAEYAMSSKGKGEYCWHPKTWLSQGHWEDDPDLWNGQQSNPNESEYAFDLLAETRKAREARNGQPRV